MVLVDVTIDTITALMGTLGYVGLFVLMALDSMPTPVPSEAVAPFASYLAYQGVFDVWTVLFVSILGSLAGSLLSYYVGLKGGRPLVLRYGKYLFVHDSHLDRAERFFQKHGPKTILISRFIPGVRALISLPAGAARMDVKKFTLYTLVGAAAWDAILVYAGLRLGENWNVLEAYIGPIDTAVIIGIVSFIVWHLVKHEMRRRC